MLLVFGEWFELEVSRSAVFVKVGAWERYAAVREGWRVTVDR